MSTLSALLPAAEWHRRAATLELLRLARQPLADCQQRARRRPVRWHAEHDESARLPAWSTTRSKRSAPRPLRKYVRSLAVRIVMRDMRAACTLPAAACRRASCGFPCVTAGVTLQRATPCCCGVHAGDTVATRQAVTLVLRRHRRGARRALGTCVAVSTCGHSGACGLPLQRGSTAELVGAGRRSSAAVWKPLTAQHDRRRTRSWRCTAQRCSCLSLAR